MAKKTIDKDTKTTKVKNVETKNDVSNKKEDEIVNLEATDISEDKNDVSEVITHDNVSENVEKMDMPENVDLIEKTEATADMLNEETVEKNENENVEDEYSDEDEDEEPDFDENYEDYMNGEFDGDEDFEEGADL